jgi:hypothetical protein
MADKGFESSKARPHYRVEATSKMVTIVVNAADRAVMTDDPILEWQPKKILDCLDEPIPNVGEPRALDGRPCILFGMLNSAEDWSGEYVNPNLHPLALSDAPKLTTPEFWTLVRKVHGLPERRRPDTHVARERLQDLHERASSARLCRASVPIAATPQLRAVPTDVTAAVATKLP